MSKRAEFLNMLLGKPEAAVEITEKVEAMETALDEAGIVNKEAAPVVVAPAEAQPAAPVEPQPAQAGVSDVADYIMALMASAEPEETKRAALEQALTTIMADDAVEVETQAEPDAEEEEEPMDEEKKAADDAEVVSERAKAFDILSELVNDMGDVSKAQEALESRVKSLPEVLQALEARVKDLEAKLVMKPRASVAKATEVTSTEAEVIKSQDLKRHPFWGIQVKA